MKSYRRIINLAWLAGITFAILPTARAGEVESATLSRPYITTTRPGTLRQDFTGLVGYKITTGTNRLCVTDLGGISIPGNTESDKITIVRARDDVHLASVDVPATNGQPGDYNFTVLPHPLILETNTMYYIVMAVSKGVSRFYDVNTTYVTTTTDANLSESVFTGSGFGWSPVGGLGKSFGVPNFKYYIIDTNGPTPPPAQTVVITAPADRAAFTAPASFRVEVTTSPDVTSVQFCQDGAGIGTVNTPPFSLKVEDLGPGNYDYVAKGRTAGGILVTSAVVRVVVGANLPFTTASFVTNLISLGVPRNDFTGLVGTKITVGNRSLTATHLGRFVLPNNTRAHEVKIVDATFTDLPGASAIVETADAPPNKFKFSTLATPVTLEAGKTYHVVTSEIYGGDTFADLNTTVIQTTEVAKCDGPVYASQGIGWVSVAYAQTYGPVNFNYAIAPPPTKTIAITSPNDRAVLNNPAVVPIHVAASPDLIKVEFFVDATKLGEQTISPFTLVWTNPLAGPHQLWAVGKENNGSSVTSSIVNITIVTNAITPNNFILTKTLGGKRNNFGGWVGYKFTTGSNALSVLSLGRIVLPDNSQSHTVKVVTATSPDLDIPGASVVIDTVGAAPGQFKYQELAAPVKLAANTMYYLISSEYLGRDVWHDILGTLLTTAPVATVNGGVYMGSAHYHWAGEIDWTVVGNPSAGYGVPDFKFAVVPENGAGGRVDGTLSTADSITTLQCQPAPNQMILKIKGAAGLKIILQGSEDLVHWRDITSQTMERDAINVRDPGVMGLQRFYRILREAAGPKD